MNVMPANASLWVDVRTIPAVNHDELIEEVGALATAAAGELEVAAAVRVIDNRPAVALDETDPLVRALWHAHGAVATTPPRLGGVPGTTDGTMLTTLGGVPTVVYGPGGKWIAHQADEFVAVDDIIEHAYVYVDAARRFLAGSPR
jgi:succinyl-diaminopimelate desuccinylase